MDMRLPDTQTTPDAIKNQRAETAALAHYVFHHVAEQLLVNGRDPVVAAFGDSTITLDQAVYYNNPEDPLIKHLPLLRQTLDSIVRNIVRIGDVNPQRIVDAGTYLQALVDDRAEAETTARLFAHNCKTLCEHLQNDPKARQDALRWAKDNAVLDIDLNALEALGELPYQPPPEHEETQPMRLDTPRPIVSSVTPAQSKPLSNSDQIKALRERFAEKRATRTGDTGPGQLTP